MKFWPGHRKNQKNDMAAHHRWMLILCNVILILVAIWVSVAFSHYSSARQTALKTESFCNTVESMKQVTSSYLNMEKGYVDNWAAYINSQNMSEDEALDYLRLTNTNPNRYAHLVNMETMEARSTVIVADSDSVNCYLAIWNGITANDPLFRKNMLQMFEGEDSGLNVLGKYRVNETSTNVISVGTRVMIRQANGEQKPYLLLRVIPVETMRSTWVLPLDFNKAEVGIIMDTGAYVVQSAGMRGQSLVDMLQAYNDYDSVSTLEEDLQKSNGLLYYQDSKKRECCWYYSQFDETSGLDILGMIPVEELQTSESSWVLVLCITGILLLLALIDGNYVLGINRRLRETAELAEQASAAKTQFLSNMSHDIRTPMNAVIGMTDLAQRHLDDRACVEDSLQKISLAGSHLLTLINDILDISKVESGKMTLNPAPFALASFTDELVAIIGPQAKDKEIKLETDFEDLPHPCLVADQLRVNQVFLNLLSNAVKYTNPDGTVWFSLREDIVPGEAEAVVLTGKVKDNGIGMSEEYQKTMYDSFSRAVSGRTDKVLGSGLGLSIVKNMVDLMGGSIECESAVGEGTCFTVRLKLPIAKTAPTLSHHSQAGSTKQDPAMLRGMRVLVAEDNDLNWEIIHTLLEEYEVESDRAENGQECVEILRMAPAGQYEAVLMDVQMPVLNGRQATRRIRSGQGPNRNIPIFAMTADAFAEDVQACMESGMDGHLAKPVEMKKVVSVLCSVRSGELVHKEPEPTAATEENQKKEG